MIGVRRWLAIAPVALALCGFDLLRSPDPDVKRGNERYAEGDAEGALGAYRAALQRGEAPGLAFNLGTALVEVAGTSEGEVREQALDEAARQFRRATDTDDRLLKSSAYYNLANTLALRGRHAEAAEAYKKALRANPANADARYNLELAVRRQEQQPEQPEQPEQEPGQLEQEPGQQPEQPGQPGQEPEQPEQEPEQPEQEPGQQPQQPPQQEQQEPGQPEQREQQQGQQEQPQQPQQGQGEQAEPSLPSPSRDQAGDRFDRRTDDDKKLDALERRSRGLKLDKIRRSAPQRGARSGSDKDW